MEGLERFWRQGLAARPTRPFSDFLLLVITWPLKTLASPIPHPSIPLASTGASTRTALVSQASTNGGWPSRHLGGGPGESSQVVIRKSRGGGSHSSVRDRLRVKARKNDLAQSITSLRGGSSTRRCAQPRSTPLCPCHSTHCTRDSLLAAVAARYYSIGAQ